MSNVDNGFERPTGGGTDNAIFVENRLVPQKAEFSFLPGGGGVAFPQVTLQDGHGDVIEHPHLFNIYLSDDANGDGLSTTVPDDFAAEIGGEFIGELTADLAYVALNAPGTAFDFKIDASVTAYYDCYIVVQIPFSGHLVVSRQLTAADFGL